MTQPEYHIIVNPVSGSKDAPKFVADHVVPLLEDVGALYKIYQTSSPKDAGKIGQQLLHSLKSAKDAKAITVVIAGGDGTAHEMIEGILEEYDLTKGQPDIGQWRLVILPCGTANALFHSLFSQDKPRDLDVTLSTKLAEIPSDAQKSLSSLILALRDREVPHSILKPLPISLTRILPSEATSSAGKVKPIPTHIVLSTSLHAAILVDSEKLRESHPGIERFGIAAAQNSPIAFKANLKLTGQVRQYSPTQQNFVEPFTTDFKGGSWALEGPFSYFLSVTSVDRLEPAFVIAPTVTSIPNRISTIRPGTTADVQSVTTFSDPIAAIEIIVIRPSRDPKIQQLQAEGASEDDLAKARAERVGAIAGYIYDGGKHINLTYSTDGKGDLEMNGEGDCVVEVFRVSGGFTWTPTDSDHEPSHWVCADGDIHTIPQGGHSVTSLLESSSDSGVESGFFVWA